MLNRKNFARGTWLAASALLISLAAGAAAEANQRLDIDLNDQILQGQNTIYLRQEIQRQYPRVDLSRVELMSVRLVAKSEFGQGRAALRVGPYVSPPQNVPGRPADFYDMSPRTFARIDFMAPGRGSLGVWQIELSGRIAVRRAVVVIDGGNGPGPGPGGRTWKGAGTACGPYQPWGTSLQCPNTSPNGGPIGMSCRNVPRGTKCYGSSYWHPNFVCTDPYTGNNSYGSNVFNMYVCD